MKKIKLLLIIPTLDSGGAEKMTLDLASNLSNNCIDVNLVSLFPNNNSPFNILAQKRGIKVIYLDKKKGFSIKTIIKLYKLLNRLEPDVVHTHLNASIYVLLWKLFHRKSRWIHTIHNIASKELPKYYLSIMKLLYRKELCIPIAISNEIKESIAEYYKLDLKKIPLINNGIDTKYYLPINTNRKTDDSIKLCFVARFSEQKNHRLLIETFNQVIKEEKNIKYYLTLAGDGILIESIKQLVSTLRLDDRVEFLGNQGDVLKLLQDSDIFVMSSIYEGLPLSILEAMSAELPIISTKVGGISDIITSGVEGVLVESNNVEQFKNAILLVGSNHALRMKMSKNSRNRAKDFDISMMTKKYHQTYENILEYKDVYINENS